MQQLKRSIKDGKLKCSKCNYNLPISEFTNDKKTSSGYASVCKACRKHHYDSKRNKHITNTGVIGLFRNECPYCLKSFTTKTARKVFCSDKCRKADWYDRNERQKI